jgi:hypothetical protein
LRSQLFSPARLFNFNKDGDFNLAEIDEPTFADKRNICVSIKVLADGASALELVDGAYDDIAEVDFYLKRMTLAMEERLGRKRSKPSGGEATNDEHGRALCRTVSTTRTLPQLAALESQTHGAHLGANPGVFRPSRRASSWRG